MKTHVIDLSGRTRIASLVRATTHAVVVGTLPILVTAVLVGLASAVVVWPLGGAWAAIVFLVASSLPVGLLLHELGHVLTAARIDPSGRRTLTTSVIGLWVTRDRTNTRGERLIAAGGPLLPTVTGALILVAAAATDPRWSFVAVGLVLHGVALVPPFGDGRRLWTGLHRTRRTGRGGRNAPGASTTTGPFASSDDHL